MLSFSVVHAFVCAATQELTSSARAGARDPINSMIAGDRSPRKSYAGAFTVSAAYPGTSRAKTYSTFNQCHRRVSFLHQELAVELMDSVCFSSLPMLAQVDWQERCGPRSRSVASKPRLGQPGQRVRATLLPSTVRPSTATEVPKLNVDFPRSTPQKNHVVLRNKTRNFTPNVHFWSFVWGKTNMCRICFESAIGTLGSPSRVSG